MDKPKISFQHGSTQLDNGKFVGTVTFEQAAGTVESAPITYPEQFDSAEEAAAHAYAEAMQGRQFPF